ncbi:MAG TPA: FhaA domain-containing protein [Candidatus Limnocylindrales bacterium]|nr:FhaA domain-containing protein [Candidatus Limnocylindrales bacterium]
MGPLAAVERFLERLFERQTARLFRTAIRPVQVQRRLERAMEADRAREGPRVVVPHRFVIRLQPDDLAGLREATPELAASLADSALAFARGHGYTLLDRPVVTLRPDPAIAAGDIEVDVADTTAAAAGDADPGHGAIEDDRSAAAGAPGATRDAGLSAASEAPAEHTAVFVVPGAEGPRATIREVRPDQSSRTVTFDGRPLTIGRAPDNTLVVRDGRASRHHARIDARRGSLVLSDLGSTNGSFVNDRRVESIALGEGDRIRIGTTSLIIESVERGPVGPAGGVA